MRLNRVGARFGERGRVSGESAQLITCTRTRDSQPPLRAPAPIEFRHQQTSRVLIAPNSRSAPPAEETGLDLRGGCPEVADGLSSDGKAINAQSAADPYSSGIAKQDVAHLPASPNNLAARDHVRPTDGRKRGSTDKGLSRLTGSSRPLSVRLRIIIATAVSFIGWLLILSIAYLVYSS